VPRGVQFFETGPAQEQPGCLWVNGSIGRQSSRSLKAIKIARPGQQSGRGDQFLGGPLASRLAEIGNLLTATPYDI
jgi:hypothetical protein